MTTALRRLVAGDEPLVEAYLARMPETTVFLRSNLAKAGLADDGSPFSGTYAGAFDEERLTGVAASFWNTNVIVAPGPRAGEVAAHAVALSGRRVGGILGPHDEVVRARAALGLEGTAARFWSKEILYALRLSELVVPPELREGRVIVRVPRDDELPEMLDWRMLYAAEMLGVPDTPETRREQSLYLARLQAQGHHFVAELASERDGAKGLKHVAYSAFNATIADVVQVGGVWTPKTLRGRGYARCAVAGSLQIARDHGVVHAVLFTGETNAAAQAAYLAIGFRPIGDYAIVFF